MPLSQKVDALVIKRQKYGEADLMVTLFTREVGKLTVLAKGVRKQPSKRAASVEIGTHLEAYLIKGKGMEILTQTVIVNSFAPLKQDLVSLTQLYQLFEVLDILTRENQELPEIHELMLVTLEQLASSANRKPILLRTFKLMTELLGFTPPTEFSELALKNYIEQIAEKKLHSKDFLSPKK